MSPHIASALANNMFSLEHIDDHTVVKLNVKIDNRWDRLKETTCVYVYTFSDLLLTKEEVKDYIKKFEEGRYISVCPSTKQPVYGEYFQDKEVDIEKLLWSPCIKLIQDSHSYIIYLGPDLKKKELQTRVSSR